MVEGHVGAARVGSSPTPRTSGRLAQWQSASFTPRRSLVQVQHRPPCREEMARVYLSLGSNLGDRLQHLRTALRRLPAYGVYPRQISRVYETAPVGETPDPRPYLNLGVWAETEHPPLTLLDALKALEQEQGRHDQGGRWLPRPIDIDIILYDQLTFQHERLVIPHPRMRERAFVLVPLVEMTPDWVLPDGTPVHELLKNPLLQEQEIRPYEARLSLSGD
jgi:2-amino-4-hydroxy-6-hydroxymethyldihydropteridine diphosphokinase